ncbi:muscular LMNA-interacting protein isoform X2 [Amblyraja radiata]|nr:muscular LMNA-interacting protein isoform X2 [Amblyraja radiata]
MKSVVHINQTAKPLAFSFVPTIRRLPGHVQIVDTRFSHQPGKQRSPVTSSAMMNEVLCITEEEPSRDVGVEEGIVQGTSNQCWFNNEGTPASADEASQIQGIFKAELVFLTGSCGSDGDCFSGEDGADLSARTLPSLYLHPNPLIYDKGTSVGPHVIGDESKVLLFQDTEEKLDRTLQGSLFQSNTSSLSPHMISTQSLTSTLQSEDRCPTDQRRACLSPVSNKSPLYFIANRNTENKSSSLPKSSVLSASETSFLSSSSLPSALHTKSLSPSNSPVKTSKAASLLYPLAPLHSRSCSDLHSSAVWCSSSLPSLRSTVGSSTCVQSSPHSSSPNVRSPTSQQPSRHRSRTPDSSQQASVHSNLAKPSVGSSPPTQLSLLTSMLRSGKLTPASSSVRSETVSSPTYFSTAGLRSSSKSPSPQTSQASSSSQKARTLSPTPGTCFQSSSRMASNVSSISPRSTSSPLFPKPAAHSVHSTSTSLSKRHRNSSRERAHTPPPFPSAQLKAHLLKLANSTPTLSSLCHDSKPPISPHVFFPIRRQPSPVPLHDSSHQSPTMQEQEPLSSNKWSDPSPSKRSWQNSPSSRTSSLNYCPVKYDLPLFGTTRPSHSPTASPFSTSPILEQSVSSSPTSASSSPTPVNSFSSCSTPVNSSLSSGFLTPTPMAVGPPTTSPTWHQTPPRSSSLKPDSHSTPLNYSSSLKPPTPEQLSRQPSPLAKFSGNVNTPAHTAARFSNPSTDPPLPGLVTSPPPPSPTPRAGTHSPPLPCSTETKKPEQQYKIKSRYKAFAAIPTNTLLLDQKAIDEAVSDSMGSAAQNTSDETQSQFLFEPGTLRKQSEELYATIEKVLEDPLPMRCTSSSLNSPQRSLDAGGRQLFSPTPKSAGRETKYANLHLPSYESTEKRATRPGVIRPVTVMQRQPAMPKKEAKCPNSFTQHTDEIDDTEFKEWLFPLSAILTSVSHPTACNETYRNMPCSQDISQSIPLSLSPVTCLTSGSRICFSPIAPCNYYMTSNLSRSLHSLYIKPQHSITTIHENEALGINELVNATTKPIKDQLQRKGTERGSRRSPTDYPGSDEEVRNENEEREQTIK